MKMRVFYGEGNKISFTKEELERLLDEVFGEGFAAGVESVKDLTQITFPVDGDRIMPCQYEITCKSSPLDELRMKGAMQGALTATN